MNFLSSGAFWGLLIVLFGLSIILKAVFNIQFPFFRTFLGIILIVFGLQLVFGSPSFSKNKGDRILFSSGQLYFQPGQHDYSIIFSSGKIDLRNLEADAVEKPLRIAVVFGDGVLQLNKDAVYNIKSNVAFGELINDDEKIAGLTSKTSDKKANAIDIDASATFGKLEIRYY